MVVGLANDLQLKVVLWVSVAIRAGMDERGDGYVVRQRELYVGYK
jgi:hypothetical protein